MSDQHSTNLIQVEPPSATVRQQSSSAAPAWWVMFTQELHHLWMGGKAPLLLFIFCIFQAALTYFMVSDPSDPTPAKELVYFTLENAIAFGLLIGLIISADSISGERERLTLEALLLTPTSRRQIIVGKFLASMSPWPVALIITVPFLAALSQGDEIFVPAVYWGALMGTLLASAFTAFGMIMSALSNSNKTSLFTSLVTYLVFYIPTQLPGGAQAGRYGRFLKRINPIESNGHFLEKILVNNRGFVEFSSWLASPVIFAVIVFLVLFLYPVPDFGLEAKTPRKFW